MYSMYRSSPLRSTLNTDVITGLGMCKICTEAVHCVAVLTRKLSQVWECVKYVRKQSIALNTNVITGSRMCKVCTGTRGKGVVTGSPTFKYLWKEKVIFQTTKLGLGCLSFHQPPFPNHSVKLLPIRVAQGAKSKAKSCSLLFSVASTYTPKTSPEEPQNSPLFNGKSCHLDSRETEFHENSVYCKKKSNQILGQIFILKYHQITGSNSQWQKYHRHVILPLH